MYESRATAIRFAFDENELHRVMAKYRSENERSMQLLRRLVFQIEGTEKSYLKINGKWADQVLPSQIDDAVLRST